MNTLNITIRSLLFHISEHLPDNFEQSPIVKKFEAKSFWNKFELERAFSGDELKRYIYTGSLITCFPYYRGTVLDNDSVENITKICLALCYLFPTDIITANIENSLFCSTQLRHYQIEDIITCFLSRNARTPVETLDGIHLLFNELDFLLEQRIFTKQELDKALTMIYVSQR